MSANLPIQAWLLAAFIGSCVGLGFATGYFARRRAWSGWTIGLGSTGVAVLWPVALFVIFFLTTSPCEPRGGDPCDGPAMVIVSLIVVTPPLFVISFVLALVGSFIAWRRFRPNCVAEQAHGADPL